MLGQYPAILNKHWSVTHNYLEQWLNFVNIFSKKAFYFAFKGLCYAIFCSLRGLNVSWHKLNFWNNGPVCYLLHFSQRCKLLSWKAVFTIEFFAAVNYIITITSNEPMNHRNTQIWSKSTNHKPWAFEPFKFRLLRHRLRWLTTTKNANVSWLLNFRICMFLKSAAILYWGIEMVFCHLLL